jgi:hypothetical protein
MGAMGAKLWAMPRLSAQELQSARVRSGRLGGRPRKPTVEEARQAALEDLVPAAIRSLQAHLGDGDPTAWRAALRVFEHAFGRAPEQAVEELVVPESAAEITNMSWMQLRLLAAQLVAEVPSGDTVNTMAANGAEVVVADGGTDLAV